MRNVVFLLLIGFGLWNYLGQQSGGLAFDDQGRPVVWLFTANGCGQLCDQASSELRQRGVPFKSHVVDENNPHGESYELWLAVSDRRSYPKIAMGDTVVHGIGGPELGAALGKTFGPRYLTHAERGYYASHFTAGKPTVVLYGASWCPGCKALKAEYHAAGIRFNEIDVERSPNPQQLAQTMGIGGYPTVWVGYEQIQANVRSTLVALEEADKQL